MEIIDDQLCKRNVVSTDDQSDKLGAKFDSSSLDPENWSAFRSLAYNMVDQSIAFIQNIRETPIYNIIPIPQHVCDRLNEPLPETPQGLEKVCQDFSTLVFPYPLGNGHPRFWGWAAGSGNVGAIIAQLMAATMNSHTGGGAQASTLVERQVLQWCRQIFGFPDTFGGLIVTGTSMATIIALTVARNHALGNNRDVRLEGIVGGPRLVGYTSTETHFCVAKAFELLGLGRNALRLIPVDANYCIDMNQLEMVLLEDLRLGHVPFCVIGNAGTVNTGSIDNLFALKNFALKYKLWFHVDGAFGALAILDKQLKPRLLGIEQADSLAFDFHKWLHVPFDAGCVLLRDKKQQVATFSSHGRFLTAVESDNSHGYELFFQFGLELTRGFRSLSIWFTLKEHGIERLGQKIHENCEQVKYLASLLSHYPWIRINTPINLNIICFRIEPENFVDEKEIDVLNNNIATDIQQSGIAIRSTAVLNDRLYIRCCVMNHRTVYNDFDIFVNELMQITQKRLS
jgi:aromatic-L-amino-acid decarboxylase